MKEFNKSVQDLRTFSQEIGLNLSLFQAEIFVESSKDWSKKTSLSEIELWFADKQKELSLELENISLLECEGWEMDDKNGYLKHKSGEFFFIQGVRIKSSATREVGDKGWDQPMMTQVGFNGGILGLIRKKFDGIPYYLIEAKAEPGNPDGIQLSPTLQATFSNLKVAHKGRKPYHSELFEKYVDFNFSEEPGEIIHFRQWMSEDGGRLHLKRNLGILLEVSQDFEVKKSDNFIWLTMHQIKSLIKKNSWINPHVRGIISSL